MTKKQLIKNTISLVKSGFVGAIIGAAIFCLALGLNSFRKEAFASTYGITANSRHNFSKQKFTVIKAYDGRQAFVKMHKAFNEQEPEEDWYIMNVARID